MEGLAQGMVYSIARDGVPLSLGIGRRRLFGDIDMSIKDRGWKFCPHKNFYFCEVSLWHQLIAKGKWISSVFEDRVEGIKLLLWGLKVEADYCFPLSIE